MKLIEALNCLKNFRQPVITTNDAAVLLNINNAHASKLLARLAEHEHLVKLKHSLWAFPEKIDLLAIPAYLTAPFPSYISLQSALYYHGMIEQIPEIVYAVSLARTQRFNVFMGTISIHHIQPDFFFGFEMDAKANVAMATPEKALLDLLYLSPAKTNLFKRLPELELSERFSIKNAKAMIKRIPSARRQKMVQNQFQQLLSAQKINFKFT